MPAYKLKLSQSHLDYRLKCYRRNYLPFQAKDNIKTWLKLTVQSWSLEWNSGINECNSAQRSREKCPLAYPKQLINKRHSSLNPEDHRQKIFTTKWSKHPPTGSRRYSSSLCTALTYSLHKAYLNNSYPSPSLPPREKTCAWKVIAPAAWHHSPSSGGESPLLLALWPSLAPH